MIDMNLQFFGGRGASSGGGGASKAYNLERNSLPGLTGSEKQVKWANEIRNRYIETHNETVSLIDKKFVKGEQLSEKESQRMDELKNVSKHGGQATAILAAEDAQSVLEGSFEEIEAERKRLGYSRDLPKEQRRIIREQVKKNVAKLHKKEYMEKINRALAIHKNDGERTLEITSAGTWIDMRGML